jgi:glutaredoxin-related protein
LFVEQAVVRQNKVSAIANEQVLINSDSQFAQTVDLRDERDRVDNNAISNHAGFAAPEDSRWDQMQNIFDAAMNDCVAGIVAALTADNDVCLGSKDVDDFPLALISPLHANQDCVRH